MWAFALLLAIALPTPAGTEGNAVPAGVPAQTPEPLASLVNPFIGTGGHGHTYPGPSLPFGMIQPGPDTRLEGWDSCSGYHYSDTRLFGFSHTHLSGTGIPDYNDVLLMPISGDVRLSNGADGRPGYASRFSHADEIAAPGYYAVTLQDYGVRAELTTTVRAGLHRYAFPKGRPAHVLLDLVRGQMSAWFVLSALGFYPVAPGSAHYVIGTPLFPAATIRLDDGRTFVIRANGVSTNAYYIQRARLNGAEYAKPYLEQGAILCGGELVLDMGPQANTSWGSGAEDRPRSAIADHPIVAAPFIAGGARVFRGRTTVTLGHIDGDAAIHYTTDGRAPDTGSPRYTGPLEIADSATLKAVAIVGGESSTVITARFGRLADRLRLTLSAPYAPQYSAGGDEALVDGLRGGSDFRLGRWQGYRGVDLDATIDFGERREIRRVAVGFLQEIRAWILMPRQVTFEVSDDGATFRPLGTATPDVPEREPGSVTRDVVLDLVAQVKARYLRVRVQRYGKLPAWHPGAGEEAWYFVDEIRIEN